MRKEIVEFTKNMRAETTLDEIQAVCKTGEEIRYVLDSLEDVEFETKAVVLPLRLRMRAKKEFQNVPTEKITTQAVQIKLSIGYHTARSVQEWLKKTR